MRQHGFDKQGGFYLIDHDLRVAEYAYPSSPWADQAKRNQHKVVVAMEKQLLQNKQHGSPEIIERHYLAVSEGTK